MSVSESTVEGFAVCHLTPPLLIPLCKSLQQIPLTLVGIDRHTTVAELAIAVDQSLTLTSSMVSKHHSLVPEVRIHRVANTFVKDKDDPRSVHLKSSRIWLVCQTLNHHLDSWMLTPWRPCMLGRKFFFLCLHAGS